MGLGQGQRVLLGACAALALLAAVAAPPRTAAAQAPENWFSAWTGLYMDPATVSDDESGTVWDLGTSMAAGVGYQRELGALIAGLDFGYSPIKHEVRQASTQAVLDQGRAHLLTAMITGRLGGGGGGGFQTYLTGGIGTMVYGIPHLERWDPDLAFRAGGGLDYRHSARLAFFVQWNRWWAFHQTQGVDDNTLRHSNLQVGARYGM